MDRLTMAFSVDSASAQSTEAEDRYVEEKEGTSDNSVELSEVEQPLRIAFSRQEQK
jgi:hypothetical protein